MIATAVGTRDALDRVATAPTILDAVDRFDSVARAARHDGAASQVLLREAIADPHDPLVALAAVHAAGAVGGTVAEDLLIDLLRSGPPLLREHAAWALSAGPVLEAALDPLRAMAREDDFAGVLAGVTLRTWRATTPDAPPAPRPSPRTRTTSGLTVAQLYLHGEIDAELRHAGRGDTGGIATLLVRLGDALLQEPGVGRVLTLSRASRAGDSGQVPPDRLEEVAASPGHHYLGIPVPRPAPPLSRSWPLLPLVRESLRQQLALAGPVDVVHVRMADVGTWAVAQVARELGIPLVLTLAPDPHALLAVRERTGRLTRATFAEADLQEHLVFRIRLLRALREQAEALVVFPRPDLQRDLSTLLHVGPDEPVHVVPEGVDLKALDHADRQVALALEGGEAEPGVAAALGELDALLAGLPEERRGLPVVLSVGRLHAVKGMATLAQAWAEHPDLAQRCNLVIVGGDLEDPSHEEAEQLARIGEAVDRAQGPGQGVLLAGNRPNSTVAAWLSAVRRGRPGLSAAGGVYACASLKEEFGIALCEALGSGLVVVAPGHGGPPTYVEDGRTGVLVDTSDPGLLGEAVAEALRLAASDDADERAAHARQVVLDRFSIRTMAAALADVYRGVAG